MNPTCSHCHQPVVAGTRAVVFTQSVAYHRRCWQAVVSPPALTTIQQHMYRAWRHAPVHRLSA